MLTFISLIVLFRLFSNPAGSSNMGARKRRALPATDVAARVLKSSPVPISSAEAEESLNLLVKLCPFFLKKLVIAGEDWLEMPSNTASGAEGSESSSPSKDSSSSSKSPSKTPSGSVPNSPGKRKDSAEELVTRSPRRIKREGGGLREVREIIRRELEMQD